MLHLVSLSLLWFTAKSLTSTCSDGTYCSTATCSFSAATYCCVNPTTNLVVEYQDECCAHCNGITTTDTCGECCRVVMNSNPTCTTGHCTAFTNTNPGYCTCPGECDDITNPCSPPGTGSNLVCQHETPNSLCKTCVDTCLAGHNGCYDNSQCTDPIYPVCLLNTASTCGQCGADPVTPPDPITTVAHPDPITTVAHPDPITTIAHPDPITTVAHPDTTTTNLCPGECDDSTNPCSQSGTNHNLVCKHETSTSLCKTCVDACLASHGCRDNSQCTDPLSPACLKNSLSTCGQCGPDPTITTQPPDPTTTTTHPDPTTTTTHPDPTTTTATHPCSGPDECILTSPGAIGSACSDGKMCGSATNVASDCGTCQCKCKSDGDCSSALGVEQVCIKEGSNNCGVCNTCNTVNCLIDPCSIDNGGCGDRATCTANYCGGCHAICTDDPTTTQGVTTATGDDNECVFSSRGFIPIILLQYSGQATCSACSAKRHGNSAIRRGDEFDEEYCELLVDLVDDFFTELLDVSVKDCVLDYCADKLGCAKGLIGPKANYENGACTCEGKFECGLGTGGGNRIGFMIGMVFVMVVYGWM